MAADPRGCHKWRHEAAHFEEIEPDELVARDIATILEHIDRGDPLHLEDLLNSHGAGWAAPYRR